MPNVIVVTVEELESLICTARDRDGLGRFEEAIWTRKLEEAKEPHFLGYSEGGMCLYEIRFSL